MAVGIGEITSQGCIWTVDTRVTYILFVLVLPANLNKETCIGGTEKPST